MKLQTQVGEGGRQARHRLPAWRKVCWSSCLSPGRPAPACPMECHQYQTPLFLQSSNRSSRIPFCRDRKENGASLNSTSWTAGIMIVISSFFFFNSPKELVAVLRRANEAPKLSLATSQVTSPGRSGSSLVSVMAPCNSAGCPCLHSADPRPDKVTMAPLRPRLYTCDAI